MGAAQKVCINGRFLCANATGVQKYALGLCRELQKLNPGIEIIAPCGNFSFKGLQVVKTGRVKGFLWEQCFLPFYLWRHKSPLLINLCNSAPILYKNQITCIHDLAFLKNPQWFSRSFRKWYTYLIPRLIKKSKAVVTVSDFIKDEIINAYNVLPSKVHVVPNGIPKMDFDNEKPFDFPYLLLTGVYNARKNASFVIKMLPEIKKTPLHIVGLGSDAAIFHNSEWAHDDFLHLFKYVSDQRYYTLIKHADAVVFPSEYEGFGIPVLESLLLGTPVLVPDLPFYRRSFGDSPLYYKPSDEKSFLEELEKIKIQKQKNLDVTDLKNKYNFTQSAVLMADLISKCLKML
ncbi:MAG: Glycogen synthase [Bacteroidetes bacterium ADurb.Bin408]|nr:MAG: Glycogen synthase [Bacteroidetes bacterium ADurb.Bin408]